MDSKSVPTSHSVFQKKKKKLKTAGQSVFGFVNAIEEVQSNFQSLANMVIEFLDNIYNVVCVTAKSGCQQWIYSTQTVKHLRHSHN